MPSCILHRRISLLVSTYRLNEFRLHAKGKKRSNRGRSFLGDKKQGVTEMEGTPLIRDEWISVEHSAVMTIAHAVEASTLGFDFRLLVKWTPSLVFLSKWCGIRKVSIWCELTFYPLFWEVVQTFCAQLGGKQYTYAEDWEGLPMPANWKRNKNTLWVFELGSECFLGT